jgi:glycosyltransferase involved in cell wall biosynthesis
MDLHQETTGGVDVVRIRNTSVWLRGHLSLSTPLGLGAAVSRLIQDRSIDMIHAHELRTAENLATAPHAQSLRIPLIVSPHGTLPYSTGRAAAKRVWDWAFGRRLATSFDQVIALTAAEAAEARWLWSDLGTELRDDQIAIVPNGVGAVSPGSPAARRSFRQHWHLDDQPLAIFLGRLTERKGVHLLLSAFAEVVRRLPEAQLLIVGPDEGLLPALRSRARTSGIEGRVRFAGLMTGSDRLSALQAADVFVLPATGEGFSIAALEALACGLPVVITEGCNFPEAATAGAGLIVPTAVGPLADALLRLMQDAPLRAQMSERGRELIASSYTWPRVAGRMDEVYRTVLERRRRVSR